jgi:transcriptional regulator with XRE-family HTH domain
MYSFAGGSMSVANHLRGFGVRVRALRNGLGLTQAELAERAEISLGYVSKLERGAVTPSFTVICNLSRGLQTEMASLFTYAED